MIVTVVGAAPVYSSVAFESGGTSPAKAKPNVCVPAPPKPVLAVDIFVLVVQDVPSYVSVAEEDPVAVPPIAWFWLPRPGANGSRPPAYT